MQQGLPIPRKIAEAPVLEFGLQFYLSAFYDLESERVVGMELGPIPRSAIREYGHELELLPEEFDDLYYHVRALDMVFLKYRAKKNKT